MWVPRTFRNEDLPELHALIRARSFGVLFSQDGNEPWATHLPFMIDPNLGPPCQLLVGPLVLIFGQTTINGEQAWTFGIPNDMTLIGQKIYFQMATGSPAPHMTDGLEITIS